MRRELRCVPLLCALSLIALSCGDEPPRLKLNTGVLRVGGREIRAEIARTPSEMSRGLMYRRSLGKECGMLFPYETPRILSFWMKNTRIPLDIAFLDDGGRILQIEEMRPYDELSRTVSREPARYALEMNRGWFAENGVTVGDVVQIPNPKSQQKKKRINKMYSFSSAYNSVLGFGIWDLGFLTGGTP